MKVLTSIATAPNATAEADGLTAGSARANPSSSTKATQIVIMAMPRLRPIAESRRKCLLVKPSETSGCRSTSLRMIQALMKSVVAVANSTLSWLGRENGIRNGASSAPQIRRSAQILQAADQIFLNTLVGT